MPPGLILFVHSAVDDAGLTPVEFRLLAHISRRGDCFSSIPTMARLCRVNKDTVCMALKSLLSRCIISRHSKNGLASTYTMNPVEQWQPIRNEGVGMPYEPIRNRGAGAIRNEGASETRGYPLVSLHPSETEGRLPIRNEGILSISHKVIPEGEGAEPVASAEPKEGNPKVCPDGMAPQFEPVQKGLYLREYEQLLKHADDALKAIKANPKSYIRDLRESVCEVIAWHKAQGKPDSAERIAELEANPANYEQTTLKGSAAKAIEAWKVRKAEIRKAMQGIKN